MIDSLSPSSSRRLAIGIAIGFIGLVILFALTSYRFIESQKSEYAQLTADIDALEQSVEERERLESELASLRGRNDQEAFLVHAPTPNLAGVKLQSLVRQIVEESGGSVESLHVLDPQDVEPFVEISVRVEAEIDMLGLRRLLHAIETGQPLFSIGKIAISPIELGSDWAGERVDVKADISAFSVVPSS